MLVSCSLVAGVLRLLEPQLLILISTTIICLRYSLRLFPTPRYQVISNFLIVCRNVYIVLFSVSFALLSRWIQLLMLILPTAITFSLLNRGWLLSPHCVGMSFLNFSHECGNCFALSDQFYFSCVGHGDCWWYSRYKLLPFIYRSPLMVLPIPVIESLLNCKLHLRMLNYIVLCFPVIV